MKHQGTFIATLVASLLATAAARAHEVLIEAEGLAECGAWVADQRFIDISSRATAYTCRPCGKSSESPTVRGSASRKVATR